MNIIRGDKMKKTLILLVVMSLASLTLFTVVTFASEEVFHGGDVLYSKPVKAVLFSHKTHVEDMGLKQVRMLFIGHRLLLFLDY